MSKIIPLQIDENTTIYVESQEDTAVLKPGGAPDYSGGRVTRGGTGEEPAISARMDTLEATLRHFTRRALAPFKEIAEANVDKVTLEFGVTLGGEMGIPFITKGSAESALKVTVECSFGSGRPDGQAADSACPQPPTGGDCREKR
jgi:hypothetical protein